METLWQRYQTLDNQYKTLENISITTHLALLGGWPINPQKLLVDTNYRYFAVVTLIGYWNAYHFASLISLNIH